MKKQKQQSLAKQDLEWQEGEQCLWHLTRSGQEHRDLGDDEGMIHVDV